jgi:VCBS repeat-containing protein
MPIISQTIQSRVTGVWGAALIKSAKGKMRVLKVGDEVVKGDIILTTQNGIVRLSDSRETVAKTGDADRVIAGLNQGDLDINPAAGLNGGDGGGFEEGLRVDRVIEGVTPAGLLLSSVNESLPFNTALSNALGGLGAAANVLPFSAASSNISATEEGAPVNLGLTLPVGVPATTVVNIGKLPVIGVIQKSDGTVVTPGTVLTAADLPGLKYVPPADYNGTSPVGDFVYTVSNGTSTVTGTTTIGLTAINDTPVATPGDGSGLEDAVLPVSLGGTDVDGTIAGVTIVSLPPGSRLLLADGVTPVLPGQTITAAQAATLLFQPAPNFNGNASIVFTVTDNSGAVSAPATVSFNIIAVNDAPVAAPDVATTKEDTPVSGKLLANDIDVDGPALAVVGFTVLGQTYAPGSVVTLPGVGTLTVLVNGDYTFTPAPNYNGVVPTIGYTVSDGSLTSSSTLTLTVSAQPDPAIIGGQASGATIEDSKTTATGTLTVVDPDAGEAAFVPRTSVPGAHGSFSINAAGVWVYTLNNTDPAVQALGAGQTLPNETFTVTTIDGTTQVVTVTITGTNDAPVALGSGFSVKEDGPLVTGSVSATDADANAVLTFALNGAPPAGLVFNANGTYSFNPSNAAYQSLGQGQQQVITVPFTVTDDQGATSTKNLVITITGTNDAPVASPAVLAATEGGTPVTGSVTANDPDANAVLTFALNGTPPAGLTFNPNGSYSFDPSNPAYVSLAAGQQLVITVPYTVTDEFGATSTQNLVITITGTNSVPVAIASAFTVAEDAPVVNGAVTATDPDANSVLTFALNGTPPAGLVFNANGTYSFNPSNAAYQSLGVGQQQVITVPFTVTDDQGATSTKNLVITITGTNDSPVANPAAFTVTEGGALFNGQVTASDIDANSVLRFALNGPAPAGLIFNANGSYSFDPNNPAYVALGAGQQQIITMPFTVTDDQGATSIRNITITIIGTNGPPIAVGSAFTVAEDAAVVNGRVSATDPDGNAVLSFALNGAPPAGLTFRADGSYSFDPSNAAYQSLGVGQQTVIVVPFTVTDDQGATSTKNLLITVTGTNDAPVAVASSFTVNEDAPIVTGSVTASDVDANAVLTFALNGAPPAGLIFNANGTYSFDPSNAAYQSLATGQQRVITVPYTVTDDQGTTSTKDLVITIVGINDSPVARPDIGTAIEDTPLIVSASNGLLTNDTDVDFGASLRVTQFSIDGFPGSYSAGQTATIVGVGTLLINADGSYTFTPVANYSGPVPLVNYTVSDGTLTASSTLAISLTPVNDAPTLSLDGNSSHNTVSVQGITGLFNTGVNDAGAALAEGTADSHYSLISAPPGSTSSNNALQLSYAWIRNDADSSWIGSAALEPTGIYKYQTAFTLQAGADPRSVQIGFDIATDNFLRDILVNGVSTGISSNVQYRALTHLELNGMNAAFQAGANTITFVIDNRDTVTPVPGSAGPTGLRIDNMTATVAVITPSDVVHVADYAVVYVEGTPVSIADGDNRIRDADSTNMQSATITLTNAQTGDVLLTAGMPPGISASIDATGTIVTLSGSASSAAYEAALRAVQFSNTGSTPPDAIDRVISVVVNDGLTNSNTVTTTVHVVAVNAAPTLDLDANNSTAPGTGYVGNVLNNGSSVQIVDTDVRVGDSDTALVHSATVSIVDVQSGDFLSALALPAGINAVLYDPITGLLVLEGNATLADYQLALRGVAFSTTADAAGGSTRVIEITVNDGTANSSVALSQINVGSSAPLAFNPVQSSPGDDVMTGTPGHDVFHWSLADQGSFTAPARDTVINFSAATPGFGRSGDALDLRDLLVGELHGPNVGSLPGAVTADIGNLDKYLHFSVSGLGASASTVIEVSTSGGYTGGVYNAGAVDQVITLAGVNLMAGFTTDHQVLDDLLKRGKLITDTA